VAVPRGIAIAVWLHAETRPRTPPGSS
jgi:hypothetical protein